MAFDVIIVDTHGDGGGGGGVDGLGTVFVCSTCSIEANQIRLQRLTIDG